MSTGEEAPPETDSSGRRLPIADRNWSIYLGMVFGGVPASGSTGDHLWSWRARLTVIGVIAILLLLLWVTAGAGHH